MIVPSAVTGRCRIPCFFISNMASDSGSSSSIVISVLLMQAWTLVVFGSRPLATALRLRSESVIIPMYREPSSTINDPTRFFWRSFPASLTEADR